MDKYYVNKDEAILFIVDIQEKLARVMEQQDFVINNNGILIQAARTLHFPLLATEQYPKGLGRTVPQLFEHLHEDEIFEKMRFTAYTDDVAQRLKSHGKMKIILTGMETHVCVLQTTRDLLAAGYQVFVVADAITSRTEKNYQNGLDLMRQMGAVITNTETVLFDLLKVAGTPEFKALSPLIK